MSPGCPPAPSRTATSRWLTARKSGRPALRTAPSASSSRDQTPDVSKHRGITMFIVDLRSPGVTLRPIRQVDGGAHFNEVFFDDVRIPAANVLGGMGRGWQAATTLANERVSLGAVWAMYDVPSAPELIDRARALGRAGDLALRQELIRLWIAEQTVGLLGERIISAILRGAVPGPEGSVAKLVRTERAPLGPPGCGTGRGRRHRLDAGFRRRRTVGAEPAVRPIAVHRRRYRRGAPQHRRRTSARVAQGTAGRPGCAIP